MYRSDLETLVEAVFSYQKCVDTILAHLIRDLDYDKIAEIVLAEKKDEINRIAAQAAMDYLELPDPELPD